MRGVLFMVLLTFTPAFELRASIPYGAFETGLPLWLTVVVCVVANIALAPLVWVFLDRFINIFLRIGWISSVYERLVERSRAKLHPYIEKWGVIGLGLFIGVPLPGSGVYSGALGAYLMGFSFRNFFWASVLGVLVAGSIVTAIVVSGTAASTLFIKH
ncbi:MAG: COG2426 family protein [Candidatus Binatia bacterium]